MSDREITPATLRWDDDNQPLSQAFDDVYFSRVNGLAETEHVFLRHNNLCQRFAEAHQKQPFVIAETGFGSGLNFLAAWQLWQQTAPVDARLHFVSVEKHPLGRADLERALALWPELAALAQQLLASYPRALFPGFHRLDFGRVSLTLIFDDATRGLGQLQATQHPQYSQGFAGFAVDAWFLDGFAPAKNPHMWSDGLFQVIANLSHPSSTLATFTAAGVVKRGLQAVGFAIEKVPGFGRKRDMIRAQLAAPRPAPKPNPRPAQAWPAQPNPGFSGGEVAVIGAGLAGAHSARALAERGVKVTLIDRHERPGNEASGNPQGVVYAKLSPQAANQGDFNCLALLYAQRYYRRFWQSDAPLGANCGLLQLAGDHKQQYQGIIERLGQQDLVQWVEAEQASLLAGTSVNQPGLYFPHSGWLAPAEVCRQLTEHSNISLQLGCAVDTVRQTQDGWQLLDNRGHCLGRYRTLVIANANDANELEITAHLPLKPVRGQVSMVPGNKTSEQLNMVICGRGYVAPVHGQHHCLGATFDPNSRDLSPRAADHQHNIDSALSPLPDLHKQWQQATEQWQARVALRATTPDYLPMVGPVADPQAMDCHFAPLRRNARTDIARPGSYLAGLFVNVGHGSRGLTYTPICAQLLAAHILGEPPPLALTLNHALHPARFIIRDLIRNRR